MKINTKLIEDYIKENNLTKTEFCKLCKISTKTLYKILLYKSKFSLIEIFKLARVMNISIINFFY